MGISKVAQMLQLEADSTVGKSLKIPFEFVGVPEGKEVKDYIEIQPLTVRSWFQIKPLLAMIASEDSEALLATTEDTFNEERKLIMMRYDSVLFEILCIGINNQKEDMPDWYREVLFNSCTWEDIYILISAIFYRMSASNFMNTITILKTVSPLDAKEMIALQKNKIDWELKAVSHSL